MASGANVEVDEAVPGCPEPILREELPDDPLRSEIRVTAGVQILGADLHELAADPRHR
jgi:hypothetical protein